MKTLWLAPFLLLATACNKPAEAAPAVPATPPSLVDKAKGLASKFNAEAVKTSFTKLGESLQKLDDPAAAQQAKAKLEGMVATLKTQLGDERTIQSYMDKLGDGGTKLVQQVKAQIEKLAANPEVQKVIGPVLAELKTMLAGA